MNLRALAYNGQFMYINLNDIPVSIDNTTSILLRKQGSYMFYTKTLMRGSDKNGAYESDFVMSNSGNKFIGLLFYTDKFYVVNPVGNIITPLEDLHDYKIVQNKTCYKIDYINNIRSSIRFIADGRGYKLRRLMYADDHIYTGIKQDCKIQSDKIYLSTNIKVNDHELAYGENFMDGTVEFDGFKPIVQTQNGYKDIIGELEG